ncbi:MAG: sugar ABC transporter permease [Anaerolineae bacterium]|nr:sugar ABC transporter permease [Anaerolineae bacterium]
MSVITKPPNLWNRMFSGATGKQKLFVGSALTPIMLYMMFWVLFPIVWVILLSFYRYSPATTGGGFLGLGGENAFIGLDNFREMFIGDSLEGSTARISLINTLVFSFLYLPLNLLVTLPLAVAIEAVAKRSLKTSFRFIYFLPALAAAVGVALMWSYLYHPQRGLINMMLKGVGLTPQIWLSNPRVYFLGIPLAMWSVTIAYLWRDMGYNLIIFIAALQGIPHDFKEAATVDGANTWQIFWRITLPLLQPTMLLVCVLTMISSFQVFDIFQVMTNTGNPQNQTRVLMLDLYLNAFRYQNMGFASAESIVLFIVILFVTIIQLRVLRTTWEY